VTFAALAISVLSLLASVASLVLILRETGDLEVDYEDLVARMDAMDAKLDKLLKGITIG
jgi:hypothetical protein